MNKHRLQPRWAAHDRSETQWTAPTWITTATCLPVSFPWTTQACARWCWPPPTCRSQPGRSAQQERGSSPLQRENALVKRFDIEPYSVFSAKWSNFIGLVHRARSLLYRRQMLQENIRWKALDEIYKIYMLLHRSDLNISATFSWNFFVFLFKILQQ